MPGRRTLSPSTLTLLLVFAITGIVTAIVQHLLRYPQTGIDDADIFLVYARNLLAGHGFVFNVDGPRVEGFTSLLWVLVCTVAQSMSQHPERLLLVLSIALVSLTTTICVSSFVFRTGDRDTEIAWRWASVFLLLLLADAGFVAWNTVTLMDTSVWTCLLAASLRPCGGGHGPRCARRVAARGGQPAPDTGAA